MYTYKRKIGKRLLPSDEKTFQRDLTLLAVGIAIYQFGTYMMIGQLSNYMRTFGVDENALGTISAIGSLAGTLALLGGLVSRKIGLKWMAILNHLISVPYPLLCAFGTSAPVFTIAMIFSRLPYMFNFGIIVYLFSYRCGADKAKGMFIMSAINHVVAVFAPFAGSALIERIGMKWVLCLTALCYLICTGFCFLLTQERVFDEQGNVVKTTKAMAIPEEFRIKNFIRNKDNLPLLLLIGLLASRFLCDMSGPLDGVNMITLFYEDVLGMSTVFRGYASTALSAGVVVFLVISSRLTKKNHLVTIIVFAVLNLLADFSLLTGSVWIVIIAAFFRGSRQSLMTSCSNLASGNMPIENRTTLMSFYAAFYHIMQFAATKIGSSLYPVHAFLPFGVEITVTALWVLALIIYQRKYHKI